MPPQSPPSNEMWHTVINLYGVLRPGISQIRLTSPWDEMQEIIGTISYDPTDDKFLLLAQNLL